MTGDARGDRPAFDAPTPDAPTPDAPTPDAGVCVASSLECADGGTLRSCSGPGAMAVDTHCSWGCLSMPMVHCGVLVPTGGGVLSGDVSSTGVGMVDLAGTLDGDTGTISGVTTRPPGAGIAAGIDYELRGNVAMFRFASVRVVGTLSLLGTHPIALVADQGIFVNGVIDATGGCGGPTTAGPGGYAGGAADSDGHGPGLGHVPGTLDNGGSGAGHGSVGGAGGGGSMDAPSGAMYGTETISSLVGGSGAGGGSFLNGGEGGSGGGAVQLVSNATITITANGGVNAGGCGGRGSTTEGGGGGGAGGAILVEAPSLAFAGPLAVNGGGGGAGGGNDGANGQLSRSKAVGGTGGAMGGTGAAGIAPAGPGAAAGGGGGGGIGRIRFNTLGGTGATVDNTLLSPSLVDTGSTCTLGPAGVQ